MPALLHPRYGFRPIGYTVPQKDPCDDEFDAVLGPEFLLDATWAVELTCRCVEILAGTRSVPIRDSSINPRLLASLRRDAGKRPQLRDPRILSVRFQREVAVTRLAGVVACGQGFHAVTSEFRRNREGRYWMTQFGVL